MENGKLFSVVNFPLFIIHYSLDLFRHKLIAIIRQFSTVLLFFQGGFYGTCQESTQDGGRTIQAHY
ncbi:MAG: hypothetical protein LBT89_12475, partial [Planctomycetaceae bacterium]|nr:hypothetical protein [Planctomycetaceae bacterium]